MVAICVITLGYVNEFNLEKLSLEKDHYHWLVSIVESGCEAGPTTATAFFLLPGLERDQHLPESKAS